MGSTMKPTSTPSAIRLAEGPHGKADEEHGEGDQVEPGHHAGRHRHPATAVEGEEHRPAVADHGGDRDQDQAGGAEIADEAGEQEREEPLGELDGPDHRGEAEAGVAVDVGGPDVARAVAADVQPSRRQRVAQYPTGRLPIR